LTLPLVQVGATAAADAEIEVPSPQSGVDRDIARLLAVAEAAERAESADAGIVLDPQGEFGR
jgi:hypothetical protein